MLIRLSGISLCLLLCSARAAHAAPKVVINEVCYHPADDTRAGELVELFNHGNTVADVGGWLLIGGIDYVFPAGTSIPAGGYLVVAADPAEVRARYELDASVVRGPYSGSLDNDGDRLELWTDEGYLISFVDYGDTDPWPETPDGLGPSLERISPLREEHDAEAWLPSIVVGGTPGAPNSRRVEDPEPPPAGTQFIPQGAVWRFFRGRSEPPASWASIAFDDGNWESGAAGLGYGDGDDATVLSDMQGSYTTVYARRTFQVADPAAVQRLSISVSYDDAYVAYLNGVEIDRVNVTQPPGTIVPFTGVSQNNVEPAATRVVDLTGQRGLLVAGNNVLAVQGINSSLSNPDLSLHPTLDGVVDSAATQSTTYIAEGDVWRFFRGTSDPPGSWRDLSFVDDAWESGPSGFGFGDGDDATELLDMANSYLAVFVRKRFQVADASQVTSLRLRVDYDDGFIAYLNGVEVARANVASAGAGAAASASHEAGVAEEFTIVAASAALRTGVNVLALEGHNNSLISGDLSLIPELIGTLATGGGPGPGPDPAPAAPPRDLVINEVFGGAGGDGWLELYNPTGQTVNAGGRRLELFPFARGSYVIPGGTSVPARGRIVLTEAQLGFAPAAAPALILATGDHHYIDALNPRTVPAGMSSGRFPDGWDNRHVFATTTPNAANVVSLESNVVIHEIQYHPRDGSSGGEYVELHNRGASGVDVSGWAFTRGIEYTIPAGTTIPAGGYLVIAESPAAAQSFYGIPRPLGPFLGKLRNDAETILLRDALGNAVDRVRYADEGSWPEAADGTGPSLELAHPRLDNRHGPAWRASTGDGTPGAANASHQNDPPPVIAGVQHAPVVPLPTEEVLVTASISDERSLVGATLSWRVDGGGNATQVTMVDDGSGDDGVAGNGIYGAHIPARPDRSIVLFWIQATAQGGQSVTVPAGAPTPSFLYQVESPPPAQVRPIYRVIMPAAALNELRTRGTGSDVLLDCTFVSNGHAYYNRGIRYRGSSARSCNPLSYRVQFDHDVDLIGIKDLNINGCNTHRQWIGLDFLSRTGLPTAQSWFRKLALNGAIESDLHLRVEALEEPFLERNYPDAEESGNLYRGVGQANLDYRVEDFTDYEGNYEKHSNETQADWSDVADLCFRFDAATTSNAEFPAALEEKVDVDEWALFFAAFAVLGSSENSILLNNGDDYFLYHLPVADRWEILPWDLDSCLDEANQVLFRPTVDQIERFLEHPRYAPLYWCHLEELMASAFDQETMDGRIDLIAPFFSGARIAQLRQFVPARRSYIQSRLSPALTWSLTGGGTACGGAIIATGGTLQLEGAAPACGTTEVLVNGSPAAYDPQTALWTASLAPPGGGAIAIVCRDRLGGLVARRDIEIRSAPAGTPVPSNLASSRTLRRADSPHRVTGTITVQAGATLTIEPGVTLLFGDNGNLVVDGALVAAGTAQDRITLRSDACAGNGEGIVLRGAAGATRIAHCDVEGLAGTAGTAAGITVEGDGVQIDRSAFTGLAGRAAIEVRGGGSLQLTESRFRQGGTGLRVAGGSGQVTRCIFHDLQVAAVQVTNGNALDVDHLTVFDCTIGFDLRQATPGGGAGSLQGHSLVVWLASLPVAADSPDAAALTFSDLSGSAPPGAGNISSDPRFVDAPQGDFRLRFASPCRATGRDGTDMGAVPYAPTGETTRFLRCDPNGDGADDIADAVTALLYLFQGASQQACVAALDCDGDGQTNITDVIFNLAFLFTEGRPPPAPFPGCEETLIDQCNAAVCLQ